MCAIVGKGMDPSMKINVVFHLGYIDILNSISIEQNGTFGPEEELDESTQEKISVLKAVSQSISKLGKWCLGVIAQQKKNPVDPDTLGNVQ